MKVTLKNSAIILSSLILAACGSDSDDHSDAHEEHEHALMISQQNTTALSFLEEGAAENLDDAAAATCQRRQLQPLLDLPPRATCSEASEACKPSFGCHAPQGLSLAITQGSLMQLT